MNERMLELYTLAHVPHTAIDPSNNMPYETNHFSADKFAELIVKECASIVYKTDTDHADGLALLLLHTFGVEK